MIDAGYVFRSRHASFLAAVFLLSVAAAAVSTLPDPMYGYIFDKSFEHDFTDILPRTLLAALRVWGFWTLFAAILGAILLRVDATLGRVDALLGGFISVWIIAFVVGNALGPVGLMTSSTVWALVVSSALLLWWLGFPSVRITPPTAGQGAALLAFALIGPGLFAIQLGSPLAPFMDILATPASAQRVLTFGTYLPLDSDPYGYWDAGSQCPGAELLYAFLSIGSGVSFAVLGQTAAIVPLAGLLILATYRLGCVVGDDRVGGFAALLLLATVFFRVLPYSHGRTITYVLVGAGLAWLLESPGSVTRRALGALTLATAVGSHAVVGALAFAVAAGVVLVNLVDVRVRATGAAIGLLAGASLVATPEIIVGLRLAAPFPLVPLAQLIGIVAIVLCARAMPEHPPRQRGVTRWLRWAAALAVVLAAASQPPLMGGLQDHPTRFPLLFSCSALGMALAIWLDRKRPSPIMLAPVAVALLVGIAAEKVSAEWWTTFSDPRVRIAVNGFYRKVDYWYPYIWVFPAAWLWAWVGRITSMGLATVALIAALFWPWGPNTDPNYHQQSVAEAWSQQMAVAKGGYWGSTGDRRWAQTPAEFELAEVLRTEIAAGRITFSTHVTHVEPYVVLYEDTILFSVYTGINDDTYIVGDWEPDISNVGGRVHPRRDLAEALAARPPYVVIHDTTRNGRTLDQSIQEMLAAALQGYDEIFARDGVRLLRKTDPGQAG